MDGVTCLAPECGLVTTKHPLACEKHWKQLPRYLQQAIMALADEADAGAMHAMDEATRHARAYWKTA